MGVADVELGAGHRAAAGTLKPARCGGIDEPEQLLTIDLEGSSGLAEHREPADLLSLDPPSEFVGLSYRDF